MIKITHSSKIKINRFYEEKLGAKIKNGRWSWGAQDPVSNVIFLRVWQDQTDHGDKKIQVYWKKPKTKSNGYAERRKHLEAIENGARAIGILCQAVDTNVWQRKIKTFDDEQLLLLGDLSEDDNFRYAAIVRRFPINELAETKLLADLRNLVLNKRTDPTTLLALISSRLGQGKFGLAVRQFWNYRCSVTGSSTKAALEASHIQRWADSNDSQRLDPNNGLLLTANLHKLFDAGLITFEDSGKMLVSSKLSQTEQEIFGVIGKKLSKKPSAETINYLSYHRAKFLE